MRFNCSRDFSTELRNRSTSFRTCSGLQFEIERHEQRIEGAQRLADGDADRRDHAVDDPFFSNALTSIQPRSEILANGFHCLIFVNAFRPHIDPRTESGRQQKNAQNAASVGFDRVLETSERNNTMLD